MSKRKICVVTGTRAEYGLLYWVMKEIQDDYELVLQIIATGMHLSPEFGLTYKIIKEDGFHIDAKVEMLLSSDTPVGIAKSIGLGVIGFADALDRLRPDILVLLGDRFEILAAAQAAMVARIPIAHIHGGEATEGLIDEAIRHAVTKMSHFHFVAAELYRQRVVQLGENPEKVLNYGAPGLDNIRRLRLMSKKNFEDSINFRLGETNFLITYHPVTLDDQGPKHPIQELFKALDYFKNVKIIFTKPNADTDGRVICQMIDDYVARQPDRAIATVSLGQLRYLSAIRHVDIVIGNSSSGLIEAPALKKPTINLGDRQKGRLKADSVIDCYENAEAIIAAIQKALSMDFMLSISTVVSPYGEGNASVRIKNYLKSVDLKDVLQKKFFDMGYKI
ncbi:MAG: UDP-N-acetylglucosamine 2-epimerase [Alphaproteobacteria bacterium]|uniref:UDP-N-acetylglucosamine 2-epimerase n=1 Tax=Candidatus Nitrobium versatile TaxID=2884831 RepID=A0A953JB68_9BACT|nr:UDP-N-acetylglucosamine 2-epimerase [Candidatus Nitrobium versatile]